MQLVCVRHTRGDTQVGVSYLWAPDGTPRTVTTAAVATAARRVLDADAALEGAGIARERQVGFFVPSDPPMQFWQQHAHRTVGDALRIWEAWQLSERQRYDMQRDAQKSFADHMHDLGYRYLHEWDPEWTETVDWAGRHDREVVYGGDEPISPGTFDVLDGASASHTKTDDVQFAS